MTEVWVIEAVQRIFLASAAGEYAAIALARVWIFLYVGLLVWLWASGSRRERHIAGEALWAVVVVLLIGEILSLVILRPRPFLAVQDIVSLVPPPLTSSFPSLHTSVSTAIALFLFSANRIAGWSGLVVLLGVILGRLAVGVHYPSDILGGVILGFVAFTIVRWGHKLVRKTR